MNPAERLNYNTKLGFTIVELMVVIIVIGVLATIASVGYGGAQRQAAEAALKADLTVAASKLGNDHRQHGEYPLTLAEANLKKSNNTTYKYAGNADSFCLSASSSRAGVSEFYISADGTIKQGTCTLSGGGPIAGGDGGGDLNCPTGFIPVPGNSLFGTSDFCVMKYEAKNVGGVATSQPSGVPWGGHSQPSAIAAAQTACSGCHLITDAEWLTIAHNIVSVGSNWSGGSVGSGYLYVGHVDGYPNEVLQASANDSEGFWYTGNSNGPQRRTMTLTNGEVIWDLAGNMEEWTQGQITGSQPAGGGLAWRDWNSVPGANTIGSPSSVPSFGTPAASGWVVNQKNIGGLYSDSNASGTYGFLRGGHRFMLNYLYTVYPGIFALNLSVEPSGASSNFGVRAVK